MHTFQFMTTNRSQQQHVRTRPTITLIGFARHNTKEIVCVAILLLSIALPLSLSIAICCISVIVILGMYLWSSMT